MKNSNSDPASLDKDDGWTNLSNQGKSTLPVAAQLQNVKKLNISRNSFKILELRALNRCIEVWIRLGMLTSTNIVLQEIVIIPQSQIRLDGIYATKVTLK